MTRRVACLAAVPIAAILSVAASVIAVAQGAQGRGGQPAAPAAPANAPLPTPGPSYADAQKAIAAAHAAGAKLNVSLSCAVVDSRGDLVALGRMDGARFITTDVARGKALTSALFGQPSAALVARATNPATQALNDATGGRLRFIQGAVPIVRNGFVVGAVAGSGATSAQDEQAATAGLAGLP